MDKKRLPKITRKTLIVAAVVVAYAAIIGMVTMVLTTRDTDIRGITTFERVKDAPDTLSAAVYRELSDTQSVYVVSGKMPDPPENGSYHARLIFAFPHIMKEVGALSKDANGNWALTATLKSGLKYYTSIAIVQEPGNKVLMLADFKNEKLNYQPTPTTDGTQQSAPETP